MAEVKIPPFTKGKNFSKKQLEKKDIDWSRELSMVRIHVERVTGCLNQKYSILQGVIPITLIPNTQDDSAEAIIDMIVKVCCACINLCPSIVPQD